MSILKAMYAACNGELAYMETAAYSCNRLMLQREILLPTKLPHHSLRQVMLHHIVEHQGCTTGLTCKGQKTIGKAFAEGCPRQRPLGKILDGKGGLCRGPFIEHSAKPLARAKIGPRQRKAAVTALKLLVVSLPRAGPWKRNVFF